MTELIWDGKYTEDPKTGKRVKSAADRDRTMSLLASGRETQKGDRDIFITQLTPLLSRKKTLAEEIGALDVQSFVCPNLPLVAADNDFEDRFAKLPAPLGFAIEYTDSAANLRYYEPDFIAVASDGLHHLMETKGREDIDVKHKDRAATLWCESVTALTDTPWTYLKIPQSEFDTLRPDSLTELLILAPQARER